MSLADRFFITAILFALTGMGFGIWIGTTGPEVFHYAPVHTHISLVGWANLFLYGLWYRGASAAARSGLAEAHYWCAMIGAILMVIGIVGVVMPRPTLELVIIPGSLLTLLAMVIFLVIVLRNRSA